ncbi:PotD/PotF family extracellular solute-binding protein [Mesorhizobium sp. YR577]|jgi:ABC-type Fe3+ transport system substrate-binding protein|uniref:ABC transporter substrate-binding protein n=1 Tax=Mesorhizobium sp. YR577 TaxID=1884373 RepID=UPI0008EF5582|nr:PotD/PotF family extracellular solute-binding protein [Mesorhizobium sp. YR577]SFT47600.1 Spermidine/putrescine-binding protein [Mesorhizobium sp. YR577]
MGTFYGRGLGFTAAFLAASAVLGGSGYAAEIGKTLDEIVELAKKEPPVKIASTWRGEIIDDTVKGFKEKYGLTMELQFVSGLDDRERILNEALTGLVDSDLVNVSGELRDKFISAGVVEPIDWNALFPAIDSSDISPKGYFLGTGFNQFVLAYNKNRVAEADAPKDWESCLDPKWKGQVGVYSRPLAFVQQYLKWGAEKGDAYQKALVANNPVWMSTTNSATSLLAAGEYSLLCGIQYHAVKTILRSDPNSPITIVVPKLFPYQVGEALAVMKGGESPNSAILLAAYMATEGSKAYDAFGQSNPMKKGTDAYNYTHAVGAEPFWAGWESDGKAQSEASKAIVSIWGFPTGR